MEIDSISSRARPFLSPVCFFFSQAAITLRGHEFFPSPTLLPSTLPFLPSFFLFLPLFFLRARDAQFRVSARSTFSFHLCEYHSNSSLPDRRSNSFILRSRDRVDRFLFHSNLFSLVFNQSPRNSSSFPIVSFIRAALNRVECVLYLYLPPSLLLAIK